MTFEWDSVKAATNLAKHGVSFQLAQRVWDDPLHVIVPDRSEASEERWHAIGMVREVVILVVVHAYVRGDDRRVRIISARKATRQERTRYEQDHV